MTSRTSSPTPTDSPSLSQRPLLTASLQQIKKSVEFEPDSPKKMLDSYCENKRDPERYKRNKFHLTLVNLSTSYLQITHLSCIAN